MSYNDSGSGSQAAGDHDPPPRAVRHDGWTVACQLDFLESLAAHGHVGRAAAAVDRSASSAYRLRDRSVSFARAWQSAAAMAYHRLRDLALDRIDYGEVTDQLYHGKVVGTRTRYSDRLLVAMLDHLKPVAYDARERGGKKPTPDPGIAYAATLAAYETAIDSGTEPEVPLFDSGGGVERAPMTRAEFIAAIEARPRTPPEYLSRDD